MLSAFLASIIAVPVILYVTVAILCRVLPPPSANHGLKHRIFVSKTRHARIRSVGHSFVYPVLYVAVDLAHLPLMPIGWVNHNAFGLFSIYDRDFLIDADADNAGRIVRSDDGSIVWNAPVPHQTIKEKLMFFLARMEVDVKSIGRIYLVTTPRLLSYAFNPLNAYYCYSVDKPTSLVCVLLEVNNTFSERHIYLCDYRNQLVKSRSGYTSSHLVKRAFHVSPFNNRSGSYEAHIGPLHECRFDVLLNLVKYEDQEAKHMTARVYGDGVGLTAYSAFYSWIQVGPLTVFLTIPRIMWEAWRLAYIRGLGVYGRPNPMAHGAKERSQTIVCQIPTSFECFAMERVIDYLELLGRPLNIHLPDSNKTMISVGHTQSSSMAPFPFIDLYIHGFTFFTTWMFHFNNTAQALAMSFVRGDFSCSDLSGFLSLLQTSNGHNSNSNASSYEHVVRNYIAWLYPASNLATITASISQPLDLSGISLGQAYNIIKEAIIARFGAYWFDATAKFEWNPFQLEARMNQYAKEFEAGLLRIDPSLKEDEASPDKNERIRYAQLYTALANSDR